LYVFYCSLRSLSGLTQPIRTKHLLEELRGVYDDIDNSATKRPANAPEDDPLISWDKHSLPKGLEWMKPTPSKSKPSSANTIPETIGNFLSRNSTQLTAGLLSNDGAQISSAVGLVDKPKIDLDDLMKLDSFRRGPTAPIALNEFEKENVFMPLKPKSNALLPDPLGLLSSTKKILPSETRSEVEPLPGNADVISAPVQKEDLFTPLKRVKVAESTPATARFVSVHPSHKIPSIPENAASSSVSSLPDGLQPVQSGRKSPLRMHPHMALLTPITHVRPANTALSSCKKTSVSSLSVPLENEQLSKHHNLDIYMTPAKGFSQIGTHQDLQSGSSIGQKSHALPLEQPKSECNPSDIFSVNSKGQEEIVQPGERQQPSKMTPLPRTAHPNALNSCLYTPKSLVNPPPASTSKSLQRNTSEMPPPDVPKQSVKSSPDSAAPHVSFSRPLYPRQENHQ